MNIAEHLEILMFIAAIAALLSGYPVAFTLAGIALIFAAIGVQMGVLRWTDLVAAPSRVLGVIDNRELVAVPLFVFMGVMLEKSKIAEELLDTMAKLFGRMRGGLGISVVIVGALLAASTGIVGATVVTMGLLALPTMLNNNYAPSLATGSIAAAGTLGQIIPPSIVLVLLGDQISNAYQRAQLDMGIFAAETVSVGDLFAGALLPGLVLVGAYILYQIVIAILRPEAAPPARFAEGDRTDIVHVLHALAPPIILIVAVLGSILTGLATPTQGAAVGALGATFIAGFRRGDDMPAARLTKLLVLFGAGAFVALLTLNATMDLRLGREQTSGVEDAGVVAAFFLSALVAVGGYAALYRLWGSRCVQDVTRDTARITSMVFVILIGATVFSLVFISLEGDALVASILNGSANGILSFLGGLFAGVGFDVTAEGLLANEAARAAATMLVVMAVMFLLGFFLDFIEITFVVVPLVAPPLLMLGVDPIWLGVMMAINLQTSFLTPPFGFALFYLRGVAPASVPTGQIYRGALPFVGIQIAVLGLVAAFPALATALPPLLSGR